MRGMRSFSSIEELLALKRAGFKSLIFDVFPPIHMIKVYRCKNCGHKFLVPRIKLLVAPPYIEHACPKCGSTRLEVREEQLLYWRDVFE